MNGLYTAPLPNQQRPAPAATQAPQAAPAAPPTTGGQPQAPSSSLDGGLQLLKSQSRDYAISLMQRYNNEAQALEQQYMSDEQFANKRASLQAKYKDAWLQRDFAIKQSTQAIGRIRVAVAKGEMDARMGEQAVWKMVLEPETYAAKYPKATAKREPAPLSSAGIRSSSALMSEFMAGAEEKRGWEWGKPKMTKESLVDQYTAWQDQVGYRHLDSKHQDQLDLRWDAMMRSDKQFSTWFSDKGKKKPIAEIKLLRAKGPIGKEMSKRLVPPSTRAVDTPVGTSIRKTMVKQPQRQQPPSQEELKAIRTPAAYEQGVKLGYWK